MKIIYNTTLEDYKAAHRLLRGRTFFSRYDLFVWLALVVLSGSVIGHFGAPSEIHSLAGTLFVSSSLMSVLTLLVRLRAPYWGYRRNHNRNRASKESSTEFSPDGIRDTMPGIRETSYPWSSVTGFGQNEKVTILRHEGHGFTFFPTSALSSGERAELDALVSRFGITRWSC